MQCKCGWTMDGAPWYAHHLYHELDQLKQRMAKMSADQSHLDADVQALNDGLTAVEAEVAALKQQNPAVDFTGLDAAVSRLQADEPAPAAPAAPTGDQPSA